MLDMKADKTMENVVERDDTFRVAFLLPLKTCESEKSGRHCMEHVEFAVIEFRNVSRGIISLGRNTYVVKT